jgi:hypothetical protein
MNMRDRFHLLPTALALALGFSACSSAGSSGSVPSAQTPLAVPAIAMTQIAGEYKGSVTDSKRGKGTGALQLSQSNANTGGSFNQTYGNTTVRGVVALGLSGTTLGGNEVLLGGPCTFSMTAKYNAKTAVLSGSYTAISRCKGQSGTFKLTEQCYYVTPSAAADSERPNNVTIKPC